jgi:hypothetical protein
MAAAPKFHFDDHRAIDLMHANEVLRIFSVAERSRYSTAARCASYKRQRFTLLASLFDDVAATVDVGTIADL